MQLIDEIIQVLSSDKPSIENALIKAQVLAYRLGEEELRIWVGSELKGYSPDTELPPYRIIPITVMGNITNGVYRYLNHPVPVAHLETEMRERLQTSRLIQSIAVLANWADSDNLAIGIPPELCPLLSKGLDGDYWVERAWGKHSPGAMLSVLVEVRSRLLDFALRISETFPKELEPEELKKASKENSVAEAFQHSVFGNNATFGDNITILIGTGSIHDVHNAVGKNDFNSLAAALRSNSVSENDISELQVAIEGDSDSLDNKANKLGPNVRNWIGGMVAKAETSAWQLAIGTAGSLLAALIGAYYSFPK